MEAHDMETLKRITQLRDERGWSNYRLAKEANISQTTLRNLYNRSTLPSIPTLEAICSGFSISMSQFFAEGDEPVELDTGQKEMLNRWNTLAKDQQEALLELLKKM
jgi:transcriptional regulator with XRE-family HTH domain